VNDAVQGRNGCLKSLREGYLVGAVSGLTGRGGVAVGDAGTEKGPLWKPGDGLRSFTRAERAWVMDHPTFRLLLALTATVGTAVSDLLSRHIQGLDRWVVVALIPATLGVFIQLWLRGQLQRPYTLSPVRQPSRSWW